ncbi:MAG: translesion DNA synthesis-associated protein ImuA [Burkholderiaceae bacterium]|nr:translesion DNA synthesis-associated protein ImuA [Burkholderiaceae bacterium]
MRSLAPAFPADQALPVWRADRIDLSAGAASAAHPTGFAALDAELPGGGWPAAGLTELLLAAPGGGELRLLAPLLAQGFEQAGNLLCIAPPFRPYAPALRALGWPLERLLLVTPESLADAVWAAEQGLRAGACTAVLWWQGEGRSSAAALATALRRLHLAAQEGACPLLALRPLAARVQSSPAPLRLALEPAAQGQLAVNIFKRRGPAMAEPLLLALPVAGLPACRALRRVPVPTVLPAPSIAAVPLPEPADAVVCAASERIAA